MNQFKVALLPLDSCRCLGQDCESKTTCIRYLACNDSGYRVPFTNRYCADGTTDYYQTVEDRWNMTYEQWKEKYT